MPLTQVSVLNNNITGAGPDGLSEEYFGTVVINGATPVNLGASRYQPGDIVQFGLLTVGGTVGDLPTIKTTTAGAATVAGTASDTSTYTYIGFTPIAQQ